MNRRAMTLLDVLACLCAILMGITLFSVGFSCDGGSSSGDKTSIPTDSVGTASSTTSTATSPLSQMQRHARMLEDASKLQSISQGLSTWGSSNNDNWVIPGDIARLPADTDGDGVGDLYMRGIGPLNYAANDHAALYAYLIMGNIIPPDLCISAAEANPNIQPMTNYNYDKYSPHEGVFWDDNFSTNFDQGAHLSFGTQLLRGDRLSKNWNGRRNAKVGILANRGVGTGKGTQRIPDGSDAMRNSIAAQMYGDRGQWKGNVLYADNHIEAGTTSTPTGHQPLASGVPDDIFANDDTTSGSDVFLCITKGGSMTADPDDQLGYALSWD